MHQKVRREHSRAEFDSWWEDYQRTALRKAKVQSRRCRDAEPWDILSAMWLLQLDKCETGKRWFKDAAPMKAGFSNTDWGQLASEAAKPIKRFEERCRCREQNAEDLDYRTNGRDLPEEIAIAGEMAEIAYEIIRNNFSSEEQLALFEDFQRHSYDDQGPSDDDQGPKPSGPSSGAINTQRCRARKKLRTLLVGAGVLSLLFFLLFGLQPFPKETTGDNLAGRAKAAPLQKPESPNTQELLAKTHELAEPPNTQLFIAKTHEFSEPPHNQLLIAKTHELSEPPHNQLLIAKTHELSEPPDNQVLIAKTHELSDPPDNQLLIAKTHELSDPPKTQLLIAKTHELSDPPMSNILLAKTHWPFNRLQIPGASLVLTA